MTGAVDVVLVEEVADDVVHLELWPLYRAKRGGRDQVAQCSCAAGTTMCHEDGVLAPS